jgi:hypothetical protein
MIPNRSASTQHNRSRAFLRACLALAALSALADPTRAQPPVQTTCAGYNVDTALANYSTANGCPTLPGADFYANFVGSDSDLTYGYQLSGSSGGTQQGDLNTTYNEFYYSIVNALTNNGRNTSNPNCFELVVAGTFPNVRYLAVTDNDMHYTSGQHLADLAMDTAKNGQTNPFTPGRIVSGQQQYLVPISLGSVPGGSGIWPGCAISPSRRTTSWTALSGTPRWTGTPSCPPRHSPRARPTWSITRGTPCQHRSRRRGTTRRGIFLFATTLLPRGAPASRDPVRANR